MIGIALVVAVVAALFQWNKEEPRASQSQMTTTTNTTKQSDAMVPETIDDIAVSIESEAAFDQAALDAEAAGSMQEIDQDSDSINNLGTSYDENNL